MRFFTFLFILFSGGCAFTSHEINLNVPEVEVTQNIADGLRLKFSIVDDRDQETIGNRGVVGMGAKVTAGDSLKVVDSRLRSGLEAKGYNLVDVAGVAEAELVVRLRAIKFYMETGFFSGAENVSVVLGAEARRGEKSYRQTYRYEQENRAVFIPGADELDAHINAGLTHVISAVLNDKELDAFLLANQLRLGDSAGTAAAMVDQDAEREGFGEAN